MRILVTGITGQVGGALLPLLRHHDVIAADRAVLDLARPERISETLDRLAPDLIINPAAYTAVDRAEDEPELAMRVNAEAPGALARWGRSNDIPLIHFSTDYVFDGSGTRPWREHDAASPLSIYGASKLAGELAIQAAGGDILIIRVSWVYAARGSNFLSTIVRLAQERKELRVVADQIGGPTPAALIASAVAQMISGGRENFVGRARKAHGLVHFAVARTVSWHGFAGAIIEGLRARGLPLAVEELVPITTDAYRTRAMRPRNCRFDLGRLKHVFAITPPHWQSALDRELDKVAANFLGRNS